MRPSEYVRKGWCQGVNAKDDLGIECDPWSPHATYWCIVVAIQAAYPSDMDKRACICENLRRQIEPNKYRSTPLSVSIWNDAVNRKQTEVVHALEAIGE